MGVNSEYESILFPNTDIALCGYTYIRTAYESNFDFRHINFISNMKFGKNCVLF